MYAFAANRTCLAVASHLLPPLTYYYHLLWPLEASSWPWNYVPAVFCSLAEGFSLSWSDHQQYWPFLTKFWSSNTARPMVVAMGMQSTYYWCWLHLEKQRASKFTGERKRGLRKVDSCPMKLTMVTQYHSTEGNGWFPISSSYKHQGEVEEHNHKMDHMDILKRNKD